MLSLTWFESCHISLVLHLSARRGAATLPFALIGARHTTYIWEQFRSTTTKSPSTPLIWSMRFEYHHTPPAPRAPRLIYAHAAVIVKRPPFVLILTCFQLLDIGYSGGFTLRKCHNARWWMPICWNWLTMRANANATFQALNAKIKMTRRCIEDDYLFSRGFLLTHFIQYRSVTYYF